MTQKAENKKRITSRERLRGLTITNHSGVCVGLDPIIKYFPQELNKMSIQQRIRFFLKEVVHQTCDLAAAYKIQKAFFDQYEFGAQELKHIINTIRKNARHTPIILDCKIGDVANTMATYYETAFSKYGVDAITINPYMGEDVFSAAQTYRDKGLCVLVRTSNELATNPQDIELARTGKKLWQHILESYVAGIRQNAPIRFPIVSSHCSVEELTYVRAQIGEETPVLFAGAGVQGAEYAKSKYVLNRRSTGVIVGSSRALLYDGFAAQTPTQQMTWQLRIRDRTIEFARELAKSKGMYK